MKPNHEALVESVTRQAGELAGHNCRRKLLWNLMCKHDDVDPNTNFVVFSDDNPFTTEYSAALEAENAVYLKCISACDHPVYPEEQRADECEHTNGEIIGCPDPDACLAARRELGR